MHLCQLESTFLSRQIDSNIIYDMIINEQLAQTNNNKNHSNNNNNNSNDNENENNVIIDSKIIKLNEFIQKILNYLSSLNLLGNFSFIHSFNHSII